jgi:hypothetical protein
MNDMLTIEVAYDRNHARDGFFLAFNQKSRPFPSAAWKVASHELVSLHSAQLERRTCSQSSLKGVSAKVISLDSACKSGNNLVGKSGERYAMVCRLLARNDRTYSDRF